jgi:hypothetical protein
MLRRTRDGRRFDNVRAVLSPSLRLRALDTRDP